QAQIEEVLPIPGPGGDTSDVAHLLLIRVEFSEGDPELYALPLAAQGIEAGAEIRELSALVRVTTPEGERVVFDAMFDRDVTLAVLDAIVRRRRLSGRDGRLVAHTGRALRRVVREAEGNLEPHVVQAEQSNSSIVYGDRLILKLFRRLEEGLNPDLEIGAFLTERAGFDHIPPAAGALEYRRASG